MAQEPKDGSALPGGGAGVILSLVDADVGCTGSGWF